MIKCELECDIAVLDYHILIGQYKAEFDNLTFALQISWPTGEQVIQGIILHAESKLNSSLRKYVWTHCTVISFLLGITSNALPLRSNSNYECRFLGISLAGLVFADFTEWDKTQPLLISSLSYYSITR